MKFSFSRGAGAALAGALAMASAVLLVSAATLHRSNSLALPAAVIPPDATVVVALPQGAYVHFLLLPLGRLDGVLRGRVACEPHGSRAAFTAVFPGATLDGDWSRLNPAQAFVFDPGARTLTALASSGDARSARWLSQNSLELHDAAGSHVLRLASAAPFSQPPLRMASPDDVTLDGVISQAGDGRLLLARSSAGRFAALQVGARTYRFEGVCDDGAYAFVGNYVAWSDRTSRSGQLLARAGPDAFAPPSAAGSPFGDALVEILPLGHGVYQGNYRSGAAYFTFTYGMQRIVAATRDLVSYSFPRLPAAPEFTTGDGFGADNNGYLYFARPEDDQVVFWRAGRYVRESLRFPAGNGNNAQLIQAMQVIASGDPFWPPMRPDEDALDAALLAWRIYPVGDMLGQRWIASYLGRLMLSDATGAFRYVAPPRFPFAVLGRTDDGRLWGAAPLVRAFTGRVLRDASSALWWSRDGVHWQPAAQISGDAGAVGLNHNTPWVALTQPSAGPAAIAVQRLDAAASSATGGTYAGEQLFFAQLERGFYLVWGVTPGRRLAGMQGTLSAYRIEAGQP